MCRAARARRPGRCRVRALDVSALAPGGTHALVRGKLVARKPKRAKRARRAAPPLPVLAVDVAARSITLAVRLASEANERGWTIARAGRTTKQRFGTQVA